ncbi:uncharacterized protein [Diabrotica undecimpunctata]|uniref:uncharacterized protein n=1 Tax=Diabrotica undecimpunctata TaxID=50387 RepID=UPI003B63B8D3
MAVPTICYLVFDTSSGNKIRAWVAMTHELLMFLLLTTSCQYVTDTTSKFTENIYKCPWIYWNTKNRKMLLIIMISSKKKWNVTCYDIFSINNKFISQGFKQVYRFVTAAANLRKM